MASRQRGAIRAADLPWAALDFVCIARQSFVLMPAGSAQQIAGRPLMPFPRCDGTAWLLLKKRSIRLRALYRKGLKRIGSLRLALGGRW